MPLLDIRNLTIEFMTSDGPVKAVDRVSMTLNAMTSSAGANTPCNTVTNCSSIPKSFHPKTQLKEPNESHSAPSQRVPPLSSLP